MAAQIFACGGTVEKYIGDEIFAVFGLLKADRVSPLPRIMPPTTPEPM